MLDAKLFINAVQMLQEEKQISPQIVEEALKEGFDKAYRYAFDPEANLRVDVDLNAATIRMYNIITVKDEVEDDLTEISTKDAQKENPNYKEGDEILHEVSFTQDFTERAARQVLQVVKQKIRETEKAIIFSQFEEKINEIVDGQVEDIKPTYALVHLTGYKTNGFLSLSQIPKGKTLQLGERVKVLISEVKKDAEGAPIMVTMVSPLVVKKMIEKNVPEVFNGEVVIEKIARFAGERTKLAVSSFTPGLDPVGAIIGENGSRIKPIIDQLGGEFIDVFAYSSDKSQLVKSALLPANVIDVIFYEDAEGREKAYAIVEDHQFTLAIGKGGSNAKVASKVCGISLDIKSVSMAKAEGINFTQPETTTYTEKAERAPRAKKEFVTIDSFKKKDDFGHFDFEDKKQDKSKDVSNDDFADMFNKHEEQDVDYVPQFEDNDDLDDRFGKENIDYDAYDDFYGND